MIGRTNAGGGGKSVGGKLTVNAPVNTNVTAKLGSKSKVVNSGDGGSAVFKGLDQGSWDVSIANSNQTVTVPVVITTDFFTTIAFFASKIVVTYPSGSTCTCSDGTTTYTATDTSGSYTFSVCRTGTWTVKCTNGSSTKSTNVSITANGQSVSVTLSYWDGTLYPTGTEGDTLSGGWARSAVDDDHMFDLYTNYKVDVTNFNTLLINYSISEMNWTRVGLSTANGVITENSGTWVAYDHRDGTNGAVSAKIDISKVTGSYYVVIAAYGYYYKLYMSNVSLVQLT